MQNVPVFARLQETGIWLVHDPRVRLDDNSIDRPLPDGKGFTSLLTDGAALCANAPRTFLNADKCVLSSNSYACGSTTAQAGIQIDINDKSVMDLSTLSGRYLYAIAGLPLVDVNGRSVPHPCTIGYRSRWEMQWSKTCTSPSSLVALTKATLSTLLSSSTDPNPYMRDVTFPATGKCDAADVNPAIEIQVGDRCYVHRHQDWNTVYDLTYWVSRHPGGARAITKWRDEQKRGQLTFPSSTHGVDRWESNRPKFDFVGRLGDKLNFRDIPQW